MITPVCSFIFIHHVPYIQSGFCQSAIVHFLHIPSKSDVAEIDLGLYAALHIFMNIQVMLTDIASLEY